MRDDNVFKIIAAGWLLGLAVSLAGAGVLIWGAIELVQWVTSK